MTPPIDNQHADRFREITTGWRVGGCICVIDSPGTAFEARVLERAGPVHGDAAESARRRPQ